jgi:hypothetical protein
MKIQIQCTGSDFLDMNDLEPLQGELKTLPEASYQKLKKSILELGFSFPVFVWKNDNKNYIIDAHQRFIALKKLKDEGCEIPKLPVVYITAKNKKEAAKKILAASSQYGEISPDSLNVFLKDFDLHFNEIFESFKFPEIDMDSFKLTFGDEEYQKFDPHTEWNDMPEFDQQNKKAFRSVIVHFVDERGVEDFFKLLQQNYTDKTKYLWYPEVENAKAIDKRWTT